MFVFNVFEVNVRTSRHTTLGLLSFFSPLLVETLPLPPSPGRRDVRF